MSTARQSASGVIGYTALDLFGRAMRPLVEDVLQREFGTDWRRRLRVDPGGRMIVDPYWQLGQITTQWFAFERQLPAALLDSQRRVVRGDAHKLLEARNAVDHHDLVDGPALALRVIDLVDGLTRAFGQSDDALSGELEELRADAAALIGGNAGPGARARRRSDYLETVLAATASVDLLGIRTPEPWIGVRLSLADAFISPALREVKSSRDLREPEVTNLRGDAVASAYREFFPHLFGGSDEASAQDELSIDDVLKVPHAVLLGGPGAGKSTLLRVVARHAITAGAGRADVPIPVLFRAADFGEAKRLDPRLGLYRFVAFHLNERYADVLRAAMEDGSGLILIDGLDEIADEGRRAEVAAEISQFARERPAIQMLVTSRVVGYAMGAVGPAFRTYRIAALDDVRIGKFIGSWLDGTRSVIVDAPTAQEVTAEVRSSPDVRDLATNPLLLTMILAARVQGGAIPSRRVELFRLATETLLHEWPLRRLRLALDEHEYLATLEPLAHDLIATGTPSISEDDLIRAITDAIMERGDRDARGALGQARALVDAIENKTGFFNVVGRERGQVVYGFIHRSFAEYLAARHLAARWHAGSLDLAIYLRRPHWADVVEMFFGHLSSLGEGSATRALERLIDLELPLERHLGSNRQLAGELVASGVALPAEATRTRIVRLLLDDYLAGHHDLSRRASVLVRLAMTDIDSIANRIVASLDDEPAIAARKATLRWLIGRPNADLLREAVGLRDRVAATQDGADLTRLLTQWILGQAYAEDADFWLIDLTGQSWGVGLESGEAQEVIAAVPTMSVTELAEVVRSQRFDLGWVLLSSTMDDEWAVQAFYFLCESPKRRRFIEALAGMMIWRDVAGPVLAAAGEHRAGFANLCDAVDDNYGSYHEVLPTLAALTRAPADAVTAARLESIAIQGLSHGLSLNVIGRVSLEELIGDEAPTEGSEQVVDDTALHVGARDRAARHPAAWVRLAACESLGVSATSEIVQLGEDRWNELLAGIRPLRSDRDERVRGAAARAIACSPVAEPPFSLLTPDLLAGLEDAEQRLGGSTEALLVSLMRRAAAVTPTERAAYATAVGQLVTRIEHASGGAEFISAGDIGFAPELESELIRLLEILPNSPWPALALGHVKRSAGAGLLIAGLIAATDEKAALARARAIAPRDVDDPSWVGAAVIEVLERGWIHAALALAVSLRASRSQDAIDEAEAAVTLFLDANPTSRVAVTFANELLL